MSEVRLGYFSPSPVLPRVITALAADGILLHAERVASSLAQFAALAAGEYDVVVTSPDNVLAYRFAARLGQPLDLRILLGIDRGLGLSLLARPEIRDPSQLIGRRVAVDVTHSGFALAMFGLLATAGIRRDEFDVVELGATPRRRSALLAGECDATMLNAGQDILAEEAGCNRLMRVVDRFEPYLGSVLATTTSWLDAHRGLARQLAAAWTEALRRTTDPRYRSETIDLITAEMGLSPTAANLFYRTLVNDREGLIPDGRIDTDAWATVLRLRLQYGSGASMGAETESATVLAAVTDREFPPNPTS
ncbi:ABC-type nitrate/sulfonate/bicarbonate transport systems periplasmic components-like protein [Acidothermus cellulolyticus 11B]|uniref:ABC-type nitrate/sulfonate/bicarbonate transport systems periplasmic components-like protein n=1 Tax=Acidothermus cellulolyticus (strain ATCC 43068 / DSM 8971 / 11B) TaxID=351607 RepID=A0LTA6_ACIC1|nr:ABC transporter substrate-binding protein [Acidothermus cellulolyticus]ABK52666.1 ABC-type nitrate/sulfonate/bicarbonate transport systems periplasmic components-like protein [Acidothermus cellulolyticus 11B]